MEFLRRLFDTDFMPHGHCYFWKPAVLWTNVLGDALIALSYFIIPFLLVRFLKKRSDIKFRPLFIGFAAFILACGTTHVIDIVSVWYPMYRLEGLVKDVTALISFGTVIALFQNFPTIVSIPTSEQWKAVQTAAANSERRFKLMIEHAPVGIIITNFRGEFLEVNDAMCDMFKRSREELIGKTSQHITHPDDINFSTEIKEQLADGYEKFMQIEKRYLRGDGTFFWAMASATSVPEEESILVHIVDITSRKQSELRMRDDNEKLESKIAERNIELQETNKDLENFIYAVTHDLRVPLHNLQGLSTVVEEELGGKNGTDDAVSALQMIGENAQKMDHLVTDLLAFSKTSKLELKKTNIDMGMAIKTAFDEQSLLYNDKQIEFKLDSLPQAFGDPAAIQQVCQNIIGNALKYSSHQAVISIEVQGKLENGSTIFQITDNGIGFDPQYSNKLFLPFQRLHHEEEFEGTGIGLATSQRIIQKHGGEIWAESSPGQGAKFYISLPIENK
ncbi:MAG: PAS domain S-box protein [Bacteroidetes bacterium]|nr:PAS domain S-box protein [Bacteroidota bacterium]